MYIVFQYTFMINSGASVDNAMFTCLAATLQYTSLHDNTAFSYFCIGGNNGMDRDDRTEYSVFFIQLFRYIFSDAVVETAVLSAGVAKNPVPAPKKIVAINVKII